MTRQRRRQGGDPNGVRDFRFEEAKRKNNPPAGLATTYEVARERQTKHYAYDPHLDPALQFDSQRAKIEALIDRGLEAGSLEEARVVLQELKNRQDAYLAWAGKAEHTSFEVDLVSLHIHERLSTRAILEAARKPEPQLKLFGETELKPHEQIEFYRHEVNWANRLILGDSLLVMNSLLVKESLAGKVQMIFVDPPYGISYASNFQSRIDRRDVKDQDADLTHEAEQIKAYRDTWKLGIHSYLTYLRDRLLLSRELLSDSGSIFVQIGDENVHNVRCLMSEIFGSENFVAMINFKSMTPLGSADIAKVYDYLLWYAKDKGQIKYRPLYIPKTLQGNTEFVYVELDDGTFRRMTEEEKLNTSMIKFPNKIFKRSDLVSSGYTESCVFPVEFEGETFMPRSRKSWRTNVKGMNNLIKANRLFKLGKKPYLRMFHEDFQYIGLENSWGDTGGGFTETKKYAVETNPKIIDRCILMTTDPGDLVLDPTSGSGTTAFCAEKGGRRWITCDTSRVALAIARQRLLTARYDYYELKNPESGPAGGFDYEESPHITLESIAKNLEIDALAERFNPQIEAALGDLNRALGREWREWEVPREAEEEWPQEAGEAHARFWSLKQDKRREIDESIARNAKPETLYDRPKKRSGVVRVSGPFTVEAIPAPMVTDPAEAPIPQFEEEEARARLNDRGGDFLADMLGLLQSQGGVLFPGGKKLALQNLRRLSLGLLHGEGEAGQNGQNVRVALSFGPQYGPLAAFQVQEAIPTAKMNGYGMLIFAGFSFDPEAQAFIQRAPVAGMEVHFAHIAPDVLVGDLLKTNRASQIFTVFGQPDVKPVKHKDGTYTVELQGVDIYDPLTGETHHARGNQAAAWFLDTDYDGQTFHICQAFFPGDADAWKKLERALKARIDPEAFEHMRGTVSFPFKPGKHQRLAVKVIDFRGNEVVRVLPLDGTVYRER